MMSSQGETKLPVLLEITTADCNPVNIPCKAGDAQHSVTLHFPEKVAYLKPFKMRVTNQGFEQDRIEKVEVDFKMVGMDMGLNWLASTHVVTSDKIYKAEFEFKVTK